MSPPFKSRDDWGYLSLLNISHRQFAAIELDQPAYAANTKRRARNSAHEPSQAPPIHRAPIPYGRLNDLHQRKRHCLYDTFLTVRLRILPCMNPLPSSGIVGDHGCALIASASCQAQAAHSAAPGPAPQLSGEMVLQRAGQACLDHLMRNEQAACTGDAEGIHQMRVAARRWRATLSALAPFVPPGARRSASNELRWIAEALSVDVFASSVLAPARAALPAASEFERLAMAIDRRRQTAHAAARTAISSARYSASMGALANWLELLKLTMPPFFNESAG